MPTYTIETPRGHKVTIEADSPDVAIQGAQRWDLEDYATSEAQKAGLNPDLVLKQMKVESAGNPKARSPKGALGPMQLMPGTAKELGVDPNDPYQNITGGVTYLRKQLDAFNGDEAKALAAYNAGPGAVRRAGGVPAYPETQAYVKNIATGQPYASAKLPASPPTRQTDARPVSQGLGLLKGVLDPIDNIAVLAERGMQAAGVPEGVRLALTSPVGGPRMTAEQIREGRARAFADAPKRPGRIGEFAGNVAGTAWIPGGPLVNGALTGVTLSHESTPQGIAGDALYGAAGGKIGASLVGGAGQVIKGVTGDALKLANKGVPLTIGQAAGGIAKGIEDRMTSVPVVGDAIRNAQRRSLEGMNRAAYNDTLAHVGEKLPEDINVGSDAYAYTKQRLSDLYDEVLQPLTVNRDTAFSQAVSAATARLNKIADPTIRANAQRILKNEVQARFDKAGQMAGEEMKAAQEALGGHINDLSKGTKYSRDAAKALGDAKTALEDLVARTSPVAGEMLAKVNKAYSYLKPLETAAAKPGARDGIFTVAGMGQGVRKGKAASTLAAQKAPHQDLFNAAAKVLPSSVPDSGTAGRLLQTALGAGLLGHAVPGAAPITTPAVMGLLAGEALYSKSGQQALTRLLTKRPPAARVVGEQIRRLAAPAGTAVAASTAVPAPVEVMVEGHPEYGVGRGYTRSRRSGKRR